MGNKENPNSHNLVKEAFAIASARRELGVLEWTMDAYAGACFDTEEPLFQEFMEIYPKLWKQIPENERGPIVTNNSAPKSSIPWKNSYGNVHIFFPETSDFVHLQTADQRSKYFKDALKNPDSLLAKLQERKKESPDDHFLDETLENGGRVIYYRVDSEMPLSRGPMDNIVDAMLERIDGNPLDVDIEGWKKLSEQCREDLEALDNEYAVRLKSKIFNAAIEIERITKLTNFKPTSVYNGKEYELDMQRSAITHKGKAIGPTLYNHLAPIFFQNLSSYLPKQQPKAPQTN